MFTRAMDVLLKGGRPLTPPHGGGLVAFTLTGDLPRKRNPNTAGFVLVPTGIRTRPLRPSCAICRFESVSHRFCTRGGSGATVSPFRRNGIAVPAQCHHRSAKGFARAAPPKVGTAVPCRASRPQPKGRGGSPLPPVAPPPRPRSGLSKKGVRPYS